MLKFAKSFGAGFALVLLGFAAAYGANSVFWSIPASTPSVNGPWLGDSNFNISTLYTAHARDAGIGYLPSMSVSQTSGQANCTQLPNDGLIQISTSAGTGYVCLPTAVGGKRVTIANATGQTVWVYGSAATFTSGVQDTVNGVTGNTLGFSIPSLPLTICVAANNGAWYCAS